MLQKCYASTVRFWKNNQDRSSTSRGCWLIFP
ncbi:hypothetical protein FKR81_42920 [Lentzea tibetensis]|uniref:Uncharacterized protein n=1 Tax=Lentzea tibetensis TaxID=2591470 RepID=A0A563EE20_9PSEU|nr:hypothetical protein FKR81_42920 [Lentzea tibetensis]